MLNNRLHNSPSGHVVCNSSLSCASTSGHQLDDMGGVVDTNQQQHRVSMQQQFPQRLQQQVRDCFFFSS
jgi:hypothetical protein